MKINPLTKANAVSKLNLKPTPRLILNELLNLANEYIAYPSQEYIARKLHVCRATVNRHIKTFADMGLITIIKSKTPEQRFANNTYFLNFFLDMLMEEKKHTKEQLDIMYNNYLEKAIQEAPERSMDFYDRLDISDNDLESLIDIIQKKTGLKTISVLNVILNISEQIKSSHIYNLKKYIEKAFENALEEQGIREKILSVADLFANQRDDILIADRLRR